MEHDSEEKETDPEPDSEKVMVAAEPMHSPQPAVPLQLMEFPTAMLEPQLMLTGLGTVPPPQLVVHGAGCMATTGYENPSKGEQKDNGQHQDQWTTKLLVLEKQED
jgi:hypothetical protein